MSQSYGFFSFIRSVFVLRCLCVLVSFMFFFSVQWTVSTDFSAFSRNLSKRNGEKTVQLIMLNDLQANERKRIEIRIDCIFTAVRTQHVRRLSIAFTFLLCKWRWRYADVVSTLNRIQCSVAWLLCFHRIDPPLCSPRGLHI